jgi:hypothetical protein
VSGRLKTLKRPHRPVRVVRFRRSSESVSELRNRRRVRAGNLLGDVGSSVDGGHARTGLSGVASETGATGSASDGDGSGRGTVASPPGDLPRVESGELLVRTVEGLVVLRRLEVTGDATKIVSDAVPAVDLTLHDFVLVDVSSRRRSVAVVVLAFSEDSWFRVKPRLLVDDIVREDVADGRVRTEVGGTLFGETGGGGRAELAAGGGSRAGAGVEADVRLLVIAKGVAVSRAGGSGSRGFGLALFGRRREK